MTVEEATEPEPEAEVFPDNVEAVNVFIAMSTQWRTAGMVGVPTGLDYSALPTVMGLCEVAEADRAEVFEGVRILEDAALEIKYEQLERRLRK